MYLGNQGDSVSDFCFHPRLPLLLSAGAFGEVKVWDTNTRQQVSTINAGDGCSLAFNPDGKLLAITADRQTIRFLDPVSLNEARRLEIPNVESIVWSPDGECFAHGQGIEAFSSRVVIRDTLSGEVMMTFEGLKDGVTGMAWSPDGSVLAADVYGYGIYAWNVHTGTLLGNDKGLGNLLGFRPDGAALFSGSYGRFYAWSLRTNASKLVFDAGSTESQEGWGLPTAISPNGRLIAYENFTVYIAEVTTGNIIMAEEGHAEGLCAMAFSLDSKQLATADFEGAVYLWNVPQ